MKVGYMYLRFVVNEKVEDSNRLQGLFATGYKLSDDQKLSYIEQGQFTALTQWFGKNLKTPTKFTRSRNPNAKEKALSWFKDSAKEHISKMRELAELLKNHGITVRMIREKRVGYIVYEDEFQVVAMPFDDTKA